MRIYIILKVEFDSLFYLEAPLSFEIRLFNLKKPRSDYIKDFHRQAG